MFYRFDFLFLNSDYLTIVLSRDIENSITITYINTHYQELVDNPIET